MKPDFELKARDLAGRIGKLKTAHGIIETPTIMPVINPGRITIKPYEMKKIGADAVITNSYLLWKNHQEEVLEQGIHNFLDFDGAIMTDSGAFQLMEYGDIEVSNAEIIDFQKRIGVDIGVILDIPTKSTSYDYVKKCVDETTRRAKQSKPLIKDSDILWSGPVQGSIYPELIQKSAKAMSDIDFQIHPIGSVVPLLVQYKYDKVVEAVMTAKKILPANRPVHLFGAGHPMFFAFAVALGVDLFDSAAYALYAKDKRYMTQSGTLHFDEMTYLPCSCPVCSSHSLNEFNEQKLALHNLYVTFQEIRTIKQAIKENSLFELLEQRAGSHPALYKVMKVIAKNTDYFKTTDPVTKSHFFVSSEFSKSRTELLRTKEALKKVKSKTQMLNVFGKVPLTVSECYPFSQFETGDEEKIRKADNDYQKISDVSKYWFGVNIFEKTDKIRVSRKTNKIREVNEKGKVVASFRANDFMILLHEGSRRLFDLTKSHRVVVKNDVSPFIKEGKSAFAKHVIKADEKIIPGQQVIVVNQKNQLLASGEALMNAKEMLDFDRGVAVQVRWSNKN